jgi:succinate dehydrogenase / fumarate reductase cytochrome b subunit
VWTSPAAQRRASRVCGVAGLCLAAIGLGALIGPVTVDIEKAKIVEKQMYRARVEAGAIKPNLHKRSAPEEWTTWQSNG